MYLYDGSNILFIVFIISNKVILKYYNCYFCYDKIFIYNKGVNLVCICIVKLLSVIIN